MNHDSPVRESVPPEGAGKRRRRRARSARARLGLILPLLRFRTEMAVGRHPIFVSSSGQTIEKWKELLDHRVRETGVSESSLFRWMNAFENFGLEGLRNRRRSDRGTSTKLRGLAMVFIWTEHLAGEAPAVIHRKLVGSWPALSGGDSRAPSYATVRRFLRSFPSVAKRGSAKKRSPRRRNG